MKTTPNTGLLGTDSIRIGGMKICDLPLAENAMAKQQIPLAEDTERQNKINNILVASPTPRVSYLESRIVECQANVVRISEMKSQQQEMIGEYTSYVSLCKFRDKEIEKIAEDDVDRRPKIKELNKQFPPYNVEAMEHQIVQSKDAVDRADEVIAKEYNSIAELREVLALCMQRDTSLRALGATITVG